MKRIYVLGSLNCDLTIRAPYLPERGETLKGSDFLMTAGGKGANQAYACAKLGGTVKMAGAVGKDAFGDMLLESLRGVGVDISCIRSTDMLIRYGGDEFLVIFPQIQKDAFTLKMRYIQDVVSRLAVDGYPDIRLSVSIGGVHRVEPLTEAIRQADQLMYRDKANKGVLRL